jgi:phosphate transport system substrate-binding protein
MPKYRNLLRRTALLSAVALLAVTAAATAGASQAGKSGTTISGAGSTFVAPLVAQWVNPIGAAYGYELQYSGVGSGGGVAAVTARTVDFGASDAPLTAD